MLDIEPARIDTDDFGLERDFVKGANTLTVLDGTASDDQTPTLLLISAKDDPFIGFTATPNDVSDSVTILDTEHGGHIGYLRYRSDSAKAKSKPSVTNDKKSKTSKFDINWIPETVSAYFNWIGLASISESSQDVVELLMNAKGSLQLN